jgi:hypothetical protein
MPMKSSHRAAVALTALFAAACRSEPKQEPSPFAKPPDPTERPSEAVLAAAKPWTDQFLAPAVLIADEVRIEGPAPLLEHVVTRPEAEYHEVRLETTPQGLLQTITLRPDAGQAEIRAQLDQWVITGLRRVTVLERVGRGNVLVTASGSAYLKTLEGGAEQRAAVLRIEGRIDGRVER